MKKNILTVIIFLATVSLANAEMKIIDPPQVLDGAVKFGVVQSLTTCVQGQLFLVTYGRSSLKTGSESYGMAISTVQMFEERDGKSLPIRCK